MSVQSISLYAEMKITKIIIWLPDLSRTMNKVSEVLSTYSNFVLSRVVAMC